jgi:hypothetical protein
MSERQRRLVTPIAAAAFALALVGLLAAGCPSKDNGPLQPCKQNSDCPKNLPACDPQAKVCTGCLSSMITCPKGMTCDDSTHTCVPANPNAPCRFNSDCVFPSPVCNLKTGQCLGCLTDSDCPDPAVGFCDSIFDGGSTFTCKDQCDRCIGELPICQRDLGVCCPADGGACRQVH